MSKKQEFPYIGDDYNLVKIKTETEEELYDFFDEYHTLSYICFQFDGFSIYSKEKGCMDYNKAVIDLTDFYVEEDYLEFGLKWINCIMAEEHDEFATSIRCNLEEPLKELQNGLNKLYPGKEVQITTKFNRATNIDEFRIRFNDLTELDDEDRYVPTASADTLVAKHLAEIFYNLDISINYVITVGELQ